MYKIKSTIENSKKVSVIILSGGQGSRLQKYGVPKQFIEVAGSPLFVHCMNIYESLDEVDEIILVINEDFSELYAKILQQYHFKKLSFLVYGGKFRHVSLRNGLAKVKHNGLVIIHNGVNPTTPMNLIRQCIQTAFEYGAVSAYVPAFHTVFENDNGQIDTVLERKRLGYTCDPQVFQISILQNALSLDLQVAQNDIPVIDLVRRLGHNIKLVLSDEANLKVSTEIDLFTTEIILSKTKKDESNTV